MTAPHSVLGESAANPPLPTPHLEAKDGTSAGSLPASFYQAAVLHADIAIVSLDTSGHILTWNTAAEHLFGRAEAEVLGLSLTDLVPSDYHSAILSALDRTVHEGSVNVYELAFIPQGGKHPVHLGVTLSCVHDPAGQLWGVMAWMRDISTRKELEGRLTRTSHMASVGTLAAGVAHHFNNIAGGVATMVDYALKTDDPGMMVKALHMSAEACTRIAYITQSLLACSGDPGAEAGAESRSAACLGNGNGAGEAANGGACKRMADLSEELQRFANAIIPTLDKKGIALELDLQAKRQALIPRLRFGLMLQHLLSNAEDAIAERAASIPHAEKRITIRTQSQGDQIMLQFSDTGCGIDQDNIQHIFLPFFTTKGVQGGGNRNNPGLGLTLVQSVVESSMSGEIWAASTPGQGTTFHILIPAKSM